MPEDAVMEYRVVDCSGVPASTGTPEYEPPVLLVGAEGLRAALAGREWLDATRPGLAPHRVEERPYTGPWTRVKGLS